jgi:DivIVA domain-containing protein
MSAHFGRTEEPVPLRADDVRDMRFRTTKLRQGYNQDDVNAFLGYVIQALQNEPGQNHPTSQYPKLTVGDVEAARFRTTTFREGYSQDDVDAFLVRVTAELRRRDRHR